MLQELGWSELGWQRGWMDPEHFQAEALESIDPAVQLKRAHDILVQVLKRLERPGGKRRSLRSCII